MMSNPLRLSIRAGALGLAAAFGALEARAVEVYPGCPAPLTTFKHIWYVDPVNGGRGRSWHASRPMEFASGRIFRPAGVYYSASVVRALPTPEPGQSRQ